MRVLITGGAGYIGKATAERLIQRGWDVRLIGLETGVDIPGAEFTTCDINDYESLRHEMRGCDTVIHLAAIPGTQHAPAHQIFHVNAAGTFNVFEAAAAEGIRRVVQASSINALGAVWSTGDMHVNYLPVNEAHPSFTTDAYSFSKHMIEEVGQYFWRRDGISSVALRFPGVYADGYLQTERFKTWRETVLNLLDELAAIPDNERRTRLAEARQRCLEYRKGRPLEYKGNVPQWPQRDDTDDPLWYLYTFDRFNLWTFVDLRDAVQALEKSLTANYEGAYVLFINDDQNSAGYDSQTLARYFFPEIDSAKIRLSGTESLVSIEKARALIGFEPEYSVANLGSRETRRTGI